ncbi:hypothetical protein [Rhizobium sp. L1K21]|uniref:hypothetical protein n=1 Tax=Rhizobium sp. L1K21 TaxID=2954933 RepID=UPI002093C853|nr:hypothetical protein [Rhizobium sp. L1K21]MCO6188103.1 hypothetical protein [Rhizobium sp. L1K21]
MRIVFSLTAAALAAPMILSTPASAEELFLTPSVGTEGAALSGGYKSDNGWGLTTKVSAFAWNKNGTVNGYPTTGNMRFLNIGATFDVYPAGGNFRVSAGARISGNKITGTQTQGAVTSSYTLKQNSVQPYLGAGYSYYIAGNMALDFEAGAYYAGTTKVTSNGNVTVNGATATATSTGTSNQNVLYPVAQLGLRMRF